MIAYVKRIKRIIMALVAATALAFGFAAAGFLGVAFVVVPGGLGILAIESGRAKSWLRNTRDSLFKTNPLTKRKTG